MDRCSSCHLYDKPREDSLCRGCRSVRRIRDFFCGGFLLRNQEARAVAALRTCVGELTDLAEIAAPLLEKGKTEASPPEEGAKGASGTPSAPDIEQAASGGGTATEAPTIKTEVVDKEENANEVPGVSEVVEKEEDPSEKKAGKEEEEKEEAPRPKAFTEKG